MDVSTIGYIACAAVILLLAIRVPIAWAIGGVAVVALFFVFALRTGIFMPDRALMRTLSTTFSSSFDLIHSYNLSMIPLFIALGHVAYKADITTEIYEAARIWLARLPGGVAIASVAGCGGFSAISGSSIACASTMGRICTPEMLGLKYDPRPATASGTLIPPSILFIIYAIFAESSIGELFLAGLLPGLISLAGYAIVVPLWVRRSPEVAPASEETYTRQQRYRALRGSLPAFMLFVIVIGVIIVKLLEIGLITPPVGLNVFVLAAAIDEKVKIGQIFFQASGAFS